eukprot:CAMPEP_0177686044 /NCGR_PEP_ID=MMETSP0447-20121125/33352_1 /TAXON_ID=0 /ORGANISM="Stygamoeba regulata, Strain BSH-02190019" /LENGTH=294 /DNA_ID=CAMNT_0019196127 /DNA_START=34 /DNA_END=918 /DNA_ORIENTATION=+
MALNFLRTLTPEQQQELTAYAASMLSSAFSHPLYVRQTMEQLTLSSETLDEEALKTIAVQGAAAIWKGWEYSILRTLLHFPSKLIAQWAMERLLRNSDGELGFFARLLSSFCSSVAATFVVYPIELAQIRNISKFPPGSNSDDKKQIDDEELDPELSVFSTILQIKEREGVTALWRGFGTVFTEQLPQTLCEHFVGTLLPIESSSGLVKRRLNAAVRASVVSVVTYPMNTIRKNRQLAEGTSLSQRSTWFNVIDMAQQKGFLSLWRGYSTHLLEMIPITLVGVSSETCIDYVLS